MKAYICDCCGLIVDDDYRACYPETVMWKIITKREGETCVKDDLCDECYEAAAEGWRKAFMARSKAAMTELENKKS